MVERDLLPEYMLTDSKHYRGFTDEEWKIIKHDLLEHKDSGFRRRTAGLLGNIRDARTVGMLIQALKSEDTDVQRAAKEALEKMKSKTN